MIISTIIGLLLYQNVLLKESENRRKNMTNAIMRMIPDANYSYRVKLRKGFYKIKTILIMMNKYFEKIKIQGQGLGQGK